jgi:hypothetical protein
MPHAESRCGQECQEQKYKGQSWLLTPLPSNNYMNIRLERHGKCCSCLRIVKNVVNICN